MKSKFKMKRSFLLLIMAGCVLDQTNNCTQSDYLGVIGGSTYNVNSMVVAV